MYGDFVEKIIEGTKYTLKECLGKGGFGNVYRVTDRHLEKDYALKLLNESVDQIRECEADLLKELKHRALPGLHDIFKKEGLICIVMEFIEGETLDSYIGKKGNLSVEEALQLGKQLSEVLSYLHCRPIPIIHGDLKPANIMIYEERIRLIDFGGALKQYEQKSRICGTRGYASPEQYKGELIKQSDIYAFGKIMVYMLTGRCAVYEDNRITAKSLKQYGIRGRLQKILLRCLSVEPMERYQSGKELMEALNKVRGISKQLPGLYMAQTGALVRILGLGMVLYTIYVCKYHNLVDIKCIFLLSVCMLVLSYVLEAFSYHLYKGAILECECSVFISEGL